MKQSKYKLHSKLFLSSDESPRYYLEIDKKISEEIAKNFSKDQKISHSIHITASLHTTTWTTSLFPNEASDAYTLPLKKEIRDKEKVEPHSKLSFTIQVKTQVPKWQEKLEKKERSDLKKAQALKESNNSKEASEISAN